MEQAVINWANDLLAHYRDRWASLLTHPFLYNDGAHVSSEAEPNPKIYQLSASVNDDADLWATLVSRHDKLHWVQSGHDVGGNAANRRDTSRGGTAIHSVFAN